MAVDRSRRSDDVSSVAVGILGPVIAEIEGRTQPVTSGRQRALLAALALRAGEPVSAERLLEDIWGDDQPETGVRAVAFQVSKLRSLLEPERTGQGSVIATSTAGYSLDVDPDRIDLHRFERLIVASREALPTDPARAGELIEAALRLWRGRPFADLDDLDFIQPEIRRIEQRHLLARRTAAEVRIAGDRHAEAVVDLEVLVEEHPLEESLVGLLMTALHRSGRVADALHAFGELRIRLGEQLGIEPSGELRRLEQQLLDGEEAAGSALPARGARVRDIEQPTGFVTFVMTDIEGSTRVVKRFPDRATSLFDRHDEILRSAWRTHGGYEVSTEGDSFFVAFDDRGAALRACAAAQRELVREPWPDGGAISVRIGVHSGPATTRGDNYIALAIHQAARVSTAANGGQTLVTAATAQHVSVPEGSRLTPLGRFRVRDFDEPQPLFRLDSEGVAVSDRPIRVLPADGHNMIRRPTSFMGRADDVSAIAGLLGRGRLVTLAGPGGVGKTRLATEIGLAQVDTWADGVWLVDLADVVSGALVPETVADAIGASVGTSATRWDDVIEHLRERTALIILDNIESHLETCAELVPNLMTHCPRIGAMTTGQEPLNVDGEVVYRVHPLPVPVEGDTNAIERSPAVQLFCDRARAAHPGFALDDVTAHDVARICARLDGSPLAIEIAGARVGTLSLSEIVDGLDDRFQLLRSRSRSLPERQRTMQGLLDWSHRLLDTRERAALRRLAVFGGTFSIPAATAALETPDLPAVDVAELVWTLVDKSLVMADPASTETRYRLHESVRAYALRHLVEAGEDGGAADRLGAWMLEQIGPWSTTDREWIGMVATEIANVRSLIGQLADRDQEPAQQLACTLARYHESVQSYSSGINELSEIARTLVAPTPTRIVLMTWLADLHLRRAEIDPAQDLLDGAGQLEAQVEPPDWADAGVERTRGEIALRTGDLEGAGSIALHALEGDLSLRARARMWSLLGIARYSDEDFDGAAEAFERELDAYLELADDAKIATAHGNVAEIAMRRGCFASAARHQLRCLELAEALGLQVTVAYSFILASRLAGGHGQWELGVQLQASAATTLADTGHELYAVDREEVDRFLERAGSELDNDTFARVYEYGGALAIGAATLAARQLLSSIAETTDDDRDQHQPGRSP